MRSKVYLFTVIMALVISILSAPVWAQIAKQGAGTINGTVTDETGGVVPGVEIAVRNVATGVERQAVTNDTGNYIVSGLNLGAYDVTASLAGFKTSVTAGQRVSADTTLTVNIVLGVGEVTDTVTVSGQAQLIKTTDTTVGHSQDAEVLEVLPVHMAFFIRQSMALIDTMPGVIYRETWDGGKGIIHGVGGNGPHGNVIGYNTDGHQSTITYDQGLRDETGPAPELIEEFRIETNQDAEKGFNAGVSVEMITKSGTNDFHGQGFWFHRNDAFDARRTTDVTVGRQKQNEFGFVVGGPIVEDHAFFMMNYTGYDYKQFGEEINTVQTDLMRGGNFTEILGDSLGTDVLGRPVRAGQIYDPMTTRPDGQGGFIRDPFEGNIIPSNRMSGVSRHLMTAYAAPNIAGAGLTNNYRGENAVIFDIDKVYLKTDIEHGDHKWTVGWEDTPTNDLQFQTPPSKLKGEGGCCIRAYRLRINHLWTLSPSLLLSTRAGINRHTFGFGKLPPANNHCPGGCVQGALTDAIGRHAIQSAVGGGFGDNTDRGEHRQGTVPVFMDVSWIKGNHNMKFGAQMSIYTGVVTVENTTAGSYDFRSRGTGLPGVGFESTGDGFAGFLLGEPDSVVQSVPRTQKATMFTWAFFAQDSWRATRKLTVNYGLRWELPIPGHETYQRWGAFSPTVSNPEAGGILGAITHWGEGAGKNGLYRYGDIGYKSFGPRLGLAYQMDDKTVLRAYYGLMFHPANGELGGGLHMPNLGYGATVTKQSPDFGLTPAIYWDEGIHILPTDLPDLNPGLFNGSAVAYIEPSETEQGNVQRLGFALERELPFEMVFRGEYVGLLGHSLPTSQIGRHNQLETQYLGLGNLLIQDINSQPAIDAGFTSPYAGFEGTVGQSLRPFPQYDWVAQFNSHSGYNLYHSGIFMLQKRFSDGLNFMLSHTIAKSLTAGDDRARLGFGLRGGTRLQHWNLLGVSKTIVPFNRSWATKASFSWELPFGRGKRWAGDINSLANQAVGGWRLAGSLVYHAGNNLTVDSGQLNPYMGPQWANSVSGVPVSTGISCGDLDRNVPGQDRIFNGAAYEFAPAFSFGNSRVHPSAQQCGFAREDLALIKDFIVNEDVNVRLGAEFQNAFNRTNWRDAGTTVNSSGFGQVNNVLAARVIQLYVKINF